MKVIIDISDPTPLSFLDVFEEGDEWMRIQGCEVCPVEQRQKCCGNCAMWTEKGCWKHLENGLLKSKPFNCIVSPRPTVVKTDCMLEWRCVKGPLKGKVRRIKDPRGVFI